MTEYPPSPDTAAPEQETPDTPALDSLPKKLGFMETAEITRLGSTYIEAVQAGNDDLARELMRIYDSLGKQVVERYAGETYALAQIELAIRRAVIRRDAGETALYMDDLEATITQAFNHGYDAIVDVLESAKSAAVADTLRGHPFDTETCDDIAALPFSQALQDAYGYLVQADLDPDEILKPFMDIQTYP